MRHLSAAIFGSLLLLAGGIRAEEQHASKPCFESSGVESPKYVLPLNEKTTIERAQFERVEIQNSQTYKLDREVAELEKPEFEKPSYDVKCTSSRASREKSYTTESASTMALKRNDWDYNLPREGRIASRKGLAKKTKPGVLARTTSSCGCTTPPPSSMGSGVGLVSAK